MALLGCVTRAKTSLAEESNRIAAMTERKLMTGAPSYPLARIPEATFDTSMGANPRTIRWNFVPPKRVEYQSGLPGADAEASNWIDPLTGNTIAGYADKKGTMCSIPAETIYGGYEEFGRCLKMTALETEPICVLDLLEKKAVGTYIASLRDKLPQFGKEHFGNELLRQVIKFAKTKFSVAPGFPTSSRVPYFPARPTGGLSIGHLRVVENIMRGEGWDEGAQTPTVNGRPALQVYAGRDDIEFAINSYKRQNGIVIQQDSITAEDPTFGKTEIRNGIQFIENPLPPKGYLAQVGNGLYEFREIQPWKNVAAKEGIIPEFNPDYYKPTVTVGGVQYPMLTIAFIIHPKAMQRQAMGSIPKIDGKPGSKMFNFEVNMVPDWAIAADPRCNKDQVYVQYRMTHAYAPFPYNPELMTAILHIAATPQYQPVNPNATLPTPVNEPVSIQPFDPAKDQGCAPCTTDPANDPRLALNRTCDNINPTNVAGTVSFDQYAYTVDESAGNLTVVVRRNGGSLGAASVVATPTAGTATSPANFTAGSPVTLNWADGEFGNKTLIIPINVNAGDDTGKQFTVVLSSPTTVTIGSIGTTTVTLTDVDEAQ